MSVSEQLAEKVVHLLSDHKAWYPSTEGKYIHVSGNYKIEIEWHSKEIARIRWMLPEHVVWHESESCLEFPKIRNAILKLMSQHRDDRLDFTIAYIDGRMTSSITIGNPAKDDYVDRRAFPDYQWLYQQEGLGKWYWSPSSGTFWFERKEDAVLFKTARYQP